MLKENNILACQINTKDLKISELNVHLEQVKSNNSDLASDVSKLADTLKLLKVQSNTKS